MMDSSTVLALLGGVALGVVAMIAFETLRSRRSHEGQAAEQERSTAGENQPIASEPVVREPATPPAVPTRPKPESSAEEIFTLALALEVFTRKAAHPRDLLESERFLRGAEVMGQSGRSAEILLDYMSSGRVAIACMALEALARRSDEKDTAPLTKRILADFTKVDLRVSYFALRALAMRAAEPVIARVLTRTDDEWLAPLRLSILREFITLRLDRGELPSFTADLAGATPNPTWHLAALIDRLEEVLPESFRAEVRGWEESKDSEDNTTTAAGSPIDISPLDRVGRVWRSDDGESSAKQLSERLERVVGEVELSLRGDSARSVALIGEPGVGKTTLLRGLARRLQADGWTIFEAGSVNLIAGQTYIGQLEERLQSLLKVLRHEKMLWIVPDFQELLWTGRHKDNPSGILDRILPSLENGELRVIAELTPAAYERLLQAKPQLRLALAATRVPPGDDREALTLARRWASETAGDEGQSLLTDESLREGLQLAKQYITGRAAPGNLLDLVDLTHKRLLTAPGSGKMAITADELLLTLSQLTGLPLGILDDRVRLDLDGLRRFFNERVIGQPEAVECLVERVGMIKAGVTDPTRPAGVFLFVGPTGTGKTEIAKTLAQYLFGSLERMLRLDMSELQTSESLDRILGSSGDRGDSTALVHAIRRQPFSVVLLDEFEKAHANVWDLFLQVFDDGRLTDRGGNVADFRHAVIIMTSNLGATLPYGAVVGFLPGQADFAATSVERAVAEAFRREFINRIDRVVVFRPLGRAEMREILHKELDDVFQRRGLRNRSWAVEWDASAIDFLLEKGFTRDLGARPLKRAVERYLLGPLATTIVNHQVPAGDQFLFVRSNGDRLDVAFVDPDAPDEIGCEVQASASAEGEPGLQLRQLVLDARGTVDEVECLEDRYDDLAEHVESTAWQQRKSEALHQLRAPGFWESPDRFTVLGLVEYMDRIEVGLETAQSLLRRLGSGNGARRRYPRDMIQRLAEQLHLLDAACKALAEARPRDAYLLVRGSRDSGTDRAEADAFAARVARMYTAWAAKRRMRLEVLEEKQGNGAEPYFALFAISGFGAFVMLEPESGLHVMESPQDTKSFNRVKARVIVAAQGDAPVDDPRRARVQAIESIKRASEATARLIVRRYREEPSPLVRDAVRGWRTGRIDLVLSGDFDVVG